MIINQRPEKMQKIRPDELAHLVVFLYFFGASLAAHSPECEAFRTWVLYYSHIPDIARSIPDSNLTILFDGLGK